MNTLSGLSDSVREYAGRTLMVHLVHGWGWTLNRGDSVAEPFSEFDAFNLTSVQVVPSEFVADGGASTRGFLGRVVQPGHLLHDLPVLAFTMSDGFDYDFTSHVCPAWRFFLGEGKLVCPPDSFPRLHGPKIIGGYGHVTADSSITQCT
jgi:hypothetical protein